jgi:sec-independent protein translocase protein TatA
MFNSIGTTEWIVIGVVVLLLFGGKKIPEFFKGIGEAVNEFKKASNDSDKKEEKKE